VKLLLDEMWTPKIAAQLRERSFDVIAICDPAHARRYAGIADHQVFALAQEEGRTIVTDNIADYELIRAVWESRGKRHSGIVYALNPPFNRHRGKRVIGQMVKALTYLLSSLEASSEPFQHVHYLREAPIEGR